MPWSILLTSIGKDLDVISACDILVLAQGGSFNLGTVEAMKSIGTDVSGNLTGINEHKSAIWVVRVILVSGDRVTCFGSFDLAVDTLELISAQVSIIRAGHSVDFGLFFSIFIKNGISISVHNGPVVTVLGSFDFDVTVVASELVIGHGESSLAFLSIVFESAIPIRPSITNQRARNLD